jgi:hypothetical protein
MAANPEHRAEKLLREYARKRRERAPSDTGMPSPMRAQLQSEIRRTFESAAERPSNFGWILALWPRFAFGAAILGLLMVAVFWNSGTGSSKQSFQVARDSSTRSAPSGPATGATQVNRLNLEDADKAAFSAPEKPLDSGRSGVLEPQRLLSEMETRGVPVQAPATPAAESPGIREKQNRFAAAPAPVTSEPVAGTERLRAKPQADSIATEPTAPALRQAIVANSALPTTGTGGELVSDAKLELAQSGSARVEAGLSAVAAPLSEATTVSFARRNTSDRYRRNFNSPPYPEILQSFEAVVQGSTLRIIDADGSVYTGTILTDEGMDRTAGKTAGGTVGADPSESGPAFGFRVTGRSRSLNQPVVLTGSVVGSAIRPTGRGPAGSPDPGGILGNGRIQGTARIGTRQEFPLEAVREAP